MIDLSIHRRTHRPGGDEAGKAGRMTTVTLQHLTNTTGTREAVFVRSLSGILKALRLHGAATAVGPYGAITVWIDDEKLYRCESMRYLHTLDAQVYGTIGPIERWCKCWLPTINKPLALAKARGEHR